MNANNKSVAWDSVERVLITKLRYHGDVILAIPVIEYLHRRYPHLQIDMLVYAETAMLVQHHPAITQVHCINRNWKQQSVWSQLRQEVSLLRRLAKRQYDVLIHLTEDWRGVILQHWLHIPVTVAGQYPRRGKSYLWQRSFTHRYPVIPSTRHIVDRHADALRVTGLSVKLEDLTLTLYRSSSERKKVNQLLQASSLLNSPFVQIHPGSRFFHKVWPVSKVVELCNHLAELDIPVVLTGAPEQQEIDFIEQVIAATSHKPISLVGKLTLTELAELTSHATCFVGVDSAPAHIAAAVNTASVVLFGPTSQAVWRPWNDKVTIVTSGFRCQPCSQKGCNNSGISDCLVSLSVDKVWPQVLQIIKRSDPISPS